MCVSSLPPAGSLDAFVSAVGDRPLSRVFWTAPSPGTLAGFCEDRYFGPANYAAFVDALADAVRPEYEAIAARGVMLQIDCPDLAMGRHTRFSEASDHEFGHVLALNVAAMNKALVNVDQAQVRVHVCWGNYAGPHHRDIAASIVWPHIAMLKAKYFLVEAGNARHAHEHAQDAARCLSANQVLVPGVIDTKSAYVEHPDLIADRLLRYAGLLGPARVMAATDCGFASTSKVRAGSERTIYSGCFRNDMHGTHTDRRLPSQTTHSA